MQRMFVGWEDSEVEVDTVWTGLMGSTPDAWPHMGRVSGRESQWIISGFNGGGMSFISTGAKAVAKRWQGTATSSI